MTAPTFHRAPRHVLAVYRFAAGYSQADLAKLAGIRPATLCHLENGRQRPRRATAEKLAEALQVDASSIFPELDWPNEDAGE